MLGEREGLLFKVLVAKYGEEGGCVKGGEGNASTWWKDLNAVREGRGLARGVGLTRIRLELSASVKGCYSGRTIDWVGVWVVRVGDGVDGSLCKRRGCWWSVVGCLLMLFCRFKSWISGDGYWVLMAPIRLAQSFSLHVAPAQ
ncbi:hypothetical protein A2U01_0019095 [Trifolium medium]|uniref:Uncharacterized protein n=1 Tax=Trifolium medium TaxID=97028 RepID=A0A392NE04_9FABA|nr:hypothetical protein [Trifolium medium]